MEKDQLFAYQLCINFCPKFVYMNYFNEISQWICHSLYNRYFSFSQCSSEMLKKKMPYITGGYEGQFSHPPTSTIVSFKYRPQTCSKRKKNKVCLSNVAAIFAFCIPFPTIAKLLFVACQS